MSRVRQVVLIAIGLELVVAVALVGWRLTRTAPPEVNLARLPPTTANAIRELQACVWSDFAAGWQELGEAYLAFGYFAEAEACLARAVERAPRQYTTLYAYANSLERMGRLAEANEQFAAAAKAGVGRQAQTCQSRIGRNCLRLDDVRGAEAAFSKALTLPAARAEHARLLVRTGRAAEAAPILNELREEHELDVRTEMIAVQADRELNRPRTAAAERAERALDRIRLQDYWAELQPIRARYGLAAAMGQAQQLDRANRHAESAALFDRAAAEASWDYVEHLIPTGARLDMMAHRTKEGLEKLDQLATRMDIPPATKLIWGSLLAETNQLQRAIEVWSQANASQPTADSHRALAEGLNARGDLEGERRERAAARLQLAIDSYRANELGTALSELEAITNEQSQEPRAWYYLGVVWSAMDRPDRAHAAFSRCLSLDPLHGRARYWRDLLAE